MSKQRTIILASASPRRKELLALIGLKFRVDVSDYEEDLGLKLRPHELAKYLSLEKARTVAHKYNDAVIIAADTFIVFRGKLLGKPHTEKEAMRMINLLNGRLHSVITGYTVLDTSNGKKSSSAIETKVWFRKMANEELRAYVKTGEPLDKAGAYAIQGIGSLIVKKIEGDYFNVIGLPVASLAVTLKKFGIDVMGTKGTPGSS
ncbi:MAG: septum formation inhibitor Maf [Nitrospirae bacterium]|nr:septum formation inhibitor Maf [Nitrospirota bacterium]